MARKAMLVAIALVGTFLSINLLFGEREHIANAQGCSGQLTMEPTDPYTLGTHVILRGTSDCGTVRFEIKGNGQTWHKAEIGTSNQTETWKTEETGSGTFEVCFVARGDGGWERAHRSCRTVYVEGGQAPPPGSQQGANVKCWVNAFSVTPGSVQVGQTVNLAAQGQCDGNMRAARFTIDGHGWGEHSTNTYNTGWNTSGYSAGRHRVCYQVTAGDWGQAATSCVNITLTQAPPPTPYVEQGPTTDNGQPGQTEDSSPSMVDHPQGDPPPALPAPSPNNNSSPSGGGNSGASSSSNGENNANTPNYDSGSVSCNANSRLHIGAIAVVSDATPDPLPLRSEPGASNTILVQIPVRQLITIIGGPVCSGKFVWWETQYGGITGWAAEINAYNRYNLLPNGAPLPGSNSGSEASPTTKSSAEDSSQCYKAMAPLFSVGDRGQVAIEDGIGSMIQIGPAQVPDLLYLDEGEQFTVVGGPACGIGFRWWQVNTQGVTGWIAEGDEYGYWLAKASTSPVAGPGKNTQSVTVYNPLWDMNYEFEVDPTSCFIVNGTEIVSNELSLFSSWLETAGDSVARTHMAFSYLRPAIPMQPRGYIEQFRENAERALGDVGCADARYQIASRSMDLSGIGNIAFGLYAERYNLSWEIEDEVSNWDQGANWGSLLQFYDNGDDLVQRLVGHALATRVGSDSISDSALVSTAARFNLR